MADILLTVPGVAVHHVLGETTVALGTGELNVVPAPSGDKDLAITVGSAGFALHKDTPFRTIAEETRAYAFSPEIEGVKGGYVKLVFPEGAEEAGSRLAELQTKWEEILVDRGFLQPTGDESHTVQRIKDALSLKEKSAEPLVSIPGVIAAQVLGAEVSILSQGTLTLVVIPSSDKPHEPLLTLTVDTSAFPLYKTTLFGTLEDDSRTYVFTPDVGGTNKGFVAIVLPEATTEASSAPNSMIELQNRFELVLVEYGLLKDGFEAQADDLARAIRQGSARIAEGIRGARDSYLAAHPRTDDPAAFSQTTHGAAHGSASGTQAIADVAHRVSGVVLGAAASAGAWIASNLVPTEPETTGRLDAAARGVAGVAGGVVEGAREVKDSAKDAAGEIVENNHGEEAREVVGNVGQSVGNVGAAAGDVLTATSGVPIAVAGLQGAAGRQREEQKEQDAEEEKAQNEPEPSEGQ